LLCCEIRSIISFNFDFIRNVNKVRARLTGVTDTNSSILKGNQGPEAKV